MTEYSSDLRILQVHNRYREPGGEDSVVDAQRAVLKEAGCRVDRFETVNPGGPMLTARRMAVAPWNPASARMLSASLSEWKPQIAHVHNTWFTLSPSVIGALSKAGVPVVMTLHNYRLTCVNAQLLRQGQPCHVCVGTDPWQGVRYRCYRQSYLASAAAAATLSINRRLGTWSKGVSQFLVFTGFQRQLMIEAGLPAQRTAVVPNFVPDPGQRTQPAKSSDTFLYVGRLTKDKGLTTLIDAWERVAPSGLKLEVVGDGPLREALESRHVEGVEFKGRLPREHVTQMMLHARGLFFPTTWYEGQPMVLLEALAAGLPIIASQIGAVTDTLGESARLVAGDWAAGVKEAASLGDDELENLSTRSRQRYEERHTPAAGLHRLLEIYTKALEESPGDRDIMPHGKGGWEWKR